MCGIVGITSNKDCIQNKKKIISNFFYSQQTVLIFEKPGINPVLVACSSKQYKLIAKISKYEALLYDTGKLLHWEGTGTTV